MTAKSEVKAPAAKAEPGVKMMSVVATAKGYAGQIREPGGDPFDVPDTPENRKASWFKPVDAKAKSDEIDPI